MISKIIKMNIISCDDLVHTINTHKFRREVIDEYNDQQHSLALFLFENFLNSLFKDVKILNNDNINTILNRFNKFLDLFNLGMSNYDFDNFSKKSCIFYLYNLYINNKVFYNVKQIYSIIRENNDNLFYLYSNIWIEQSILNIYENKVTDSTPSMSSDVSESLETYNLIYDFMINMYMYNIHTIIPNFINPIGIALNPVKYHIKKSENLKSDKYDDFNIINPLKDEYIILYDSDMDNSYINHIFEDDSLSLMRFIDSFLQIYRALFVSNDIFEFTHGNLLTKYLFVKKLKTNICIDEYKGFSEISKKHGYNYKYHETEDVILITNFNRSKISIKKDGSDYKLNKISENVGGVYTVSQDLILFLIDLFVIVKSKNNSPLYNILHSLLSKFIEDPEKLTKTNVIPYNLYNSSEKPVFSFKNVKNLDILNNLFEYLQIKNIEVPFLKSTKTSYLYPVDINITSFFKYNNINMFNDVLNYEEVKPDFIFKIHTKEYVNIKNKIIEIIKNIKIYEYLKITLESTGVNESIYEEICVLSKMIVEYFNLLKILIYYGYTSFYKFEHDDINKICIPETTLSTLYFIYYTLDKEAWLNKGQIHNLFNIGDYNDKNNMLSYIYGILE